MNTSTFIFPFIYIKVCLFHFTRCIRRHLQSNRLYNRTCRYSHDSNFTYELRKLATLVYVRVPKSQVILVFETKIYSGIKENEEISLKKKLKSFHYPSIWIFIDSLKN